MAAQYPAALYSGTSVSGTTLVSDADHASMHNNVQDEVAALESNMGTNSGTNIHKSFVAGNFPARINSSNVLQQVITGTVSASLVGTSQITGGSVSNAVIGTPTFVLGSDASGDLNYRSAGGTQTRLAIGGTGSFLMGGVSPSFDSPVKLQNTGTQALSVGSSTSYADLAGGSLTLVTTRAGTIQASASGYVFNTQAAASNDIQLLIAGTVMQAITYRVNTATHETAFALQGQAAVAAGTWVAKIQVKVQQGTATWGAANLSTIWAS